MPFLGTTDQDKNIKGFSLVEILIVIVIFSILLTMAGSMFRAYENNRYLKEAAAALMSDIKLAKQRSVSEYVERVDNVDYPVVYRITIDQDNNSYTVQGYYIKDGVNNYKYNVTKNLSDFKGGVSIIDQNYSANTVNIQTRGTSSAGTIVLQNARGSSIKIITSPMGRVRSEETLK